ncbi:MAG TPA: hypothetical protein ENN77_01435, partial [Candidatus Wirthbacteria bacterium]|nr:hypothetical protein [Candidatus Wirthbacteria bacterium]
MLVLFLWFLIFLTLAGFFFFLFLNPEEKTKQLSPVFYSCALSGLTGALAAWPLGFLIDYTPLLSLGLSILSFPGFYLGQNVRQQMLNKDYLALQASLENEKNQNKNLLEAQGQVVVTSYVVDFSALIYGDLIALVNNLGLDGQLLIPKSVINQIQEQINNPDQLLSSQGMFARQTIERLIKETLLETIISEHDYENQPNPQSKIINLIQDNQSVLITADEQFADQLKASGKVIYIPSLKNAVRNNYFVGQIIQLKLTQKGQDPKQGI